MSKEGREVALALHETFHALQSSNKPVEPRKLIKSLGFTDSDLSVENDPEELFTKVSYLLSLCILYIFFFSVFIYFV